MEQLILLGEPLVFQTGSAVFLGSFALSRSTADRRVESSRRRSSGGEGVRVAQVERAPLEAL